MVNIMKISELKKGDRVLLNYGDQKGILTECGSFDNYIRLLTTSSFSPWQATVWTKPRGKDPTIVCLKVYGWEEDIGDTYAHKIIGWLDPVTQSFKPIEHTEKQKQMEVTCRQMGF
jgi:hypothetical protein